ncbi:MAG TPA: ClbS/DfsB family four-helix bundle protein [Anaerolineae bacterium]|nr:ClbS/DfsB family four-helix bundle protein [Anaerolineae bacterium]
MSDKAQQKKDNIISALTQVRRKILHVAHTLPREKQGEVFLGEWSARELLAHLVGWDHANIEATKSILSGELPEFYSHHDSDWASYNAFLVERHKTEDYAELLHSVEASHRALVDLLATVPADEFEKDRGVRYKRYKVTIARLLQAEAEDEEEHYRQIKAFAEGGGPSSAEGG